MKRFLIFALTVLFWRDALAYRLTREFADGFYWASLPVQFLVIDSDPQRLQLLTQLANAAVTEWEEALVDNLWNVSGAASRPSSARNIIRWSTRFGAETGLSESTTLAVAIRYTGGPYIARGEIIINGSHPINSYPTHLKTVLVHELGHTLGLDHSDVASAVMAASLQTNYQGLHWDDEQGMSFTATETRRRQSIGYVTPISQQEETTSSSALGCGTVDLGDGGSGGGSPMLSLGLGLLLALLALTGRFRSRLA